MRSDSHSTSAAGGRLMKKIQRQPPVSTIAPPISGAAAVAIAEKADQVPIALPRRPGSKQLVMIARLPGTSSAPPTPCRIRAASSMSSDVARPHHKEASANTAVPIANTRRRPNRSPKAPPIMTSAVSAMR